MPRTFAPRAVRESSARKSFAVAAVIFAAFWSVFGLANFAPLIVRSQDAQAVTPRTLSLDERVAYQRALDEVYWRHTVWPQENATLKPSLDEVMPLEATRAKVEETMRKSDALARLWNRPVSGEQLQAELNRMARETRKPEVLRELWRALGDDPFVIAEVLARPALADRLARTAFDAEEEKAAPNGDAESGAPQASFDTWWGSASQQYVADAEAADGGFSYQLAEVSAAAADDTWSPMQALPVATGSAAVWTGTEVIIWGGTPQNGGRTNAGARYNPATDTWAPTSTAGGPSQRSGHAAYWTGTELLIFGGVVAVNCGGTGPCRNTFTNTGGRYNPLTDAWTPTSTAGAPTTGGGLSVWTGSKMLILGASASNVYDPASDTWTLTPRSSSPGPVGNKVVWTGTEIFTWGGVNSTTGARGGLFNPETGTWRQINNLNAPSERNGFSMVWTGTEVVVWGGYESNFVTLNTGGRYNPKTDTWTPTSTANAPAARYGHVAVWNGSEMIVHGGDLRPLGQLGLTNTGARYNPASDSWAAISTARSPVKFQHVAVWTGTEVFVWGGNNGTGTLQKEGARFNPSNDTWTPANNNDSPLYLDRGVWTGTEMLVWGQNSLCNGCGSVGARYDPATNVWRPMNLTGAPVAVTRTYGTNALWTGKEMIVWGGGRGRYNPLTDSWSAISSTNAPAEGYTAVWSGKEMLVWGSSTRETANTGGRYNPETDTWRPTSTDGAPAGRYMHTAVWSGSEMIVWGGATPTVAGLHNTGGRYNPETDTWQPTSTAGAPEVRLYHTAVWSGSEMIVWGGSGGDASSDPRLNTGARYNPQTDTWTPTATAGAPQARSDHRAIWTGSQMIVWGGTVKLPIGTDGTYTGARYNPQTDVWTATSTLSAPSKRSLHVQVWTGTQMIVWGGTHVEGVATMHGAVYNAPGASPAGNLPPTVSLSAPTGGSSYQSGDTVQFAAEVSDPDGAVTTVRFYANGHLVATDKQAPFAFAWNEVRGGDYALMAVATDDGSAEARSAEVNISVAPSTAPPACVLTAPADGSSYVNGTSVRMEATMTPNRDRAIARVEFLVDGQMVSYYEPPTYNPPYSYLYTADVAGARSLAARCTDNLGGVTTSAPRVINVDEQGFSVSGQLLESANVSISNVRIRLDGPAGTEPQYVTTTVGGMGNYYFGGLKPGQTYKITPEAGSWRWSPADATYTAISRSYTQQHFYGTRVGVAITGRLTDAGGNPVSPATVYLSGSKNAYTNVSFDGTYFFYGLPPGGTYTVQPYKNLYAFAPDHRTFENMSADQTADFTGAPQTATHTVSGRVVDSGGAPVAGLRVRLDTTRVIGTKYRTTDAQGRFSFDNLQAGETCKLWPEDFTYTYDFAPTTRLYNELRQDVSDADFVATPRVISGRVVQSGNGLAGVVVTLNGPQSGTATTGADGVYAFRGVTMRGDYNVTASKSGYAFTPNEHALKDLHEDVTAADFAGTPATNPVTYTISGKVTLDGAPAAGVSVALGGDSSATAETDAAGAYAFAGLAPQGNYTVTPQKEGFDFVPGAADFTALSGDQAADFAGTARVPRPSVGMQYYPLPRPVRLLDTRAGEPACVNPGAPLSAGSTTRFAVQTTCAGLTIPANAESVVGNATVVNNRSQAAGYVTLFRGGTTRPGVSTINYGGMQVLSNAFTVGLGDGGAFQVYALSTTDMIVDITGYYAPPSSGGLYFHPLPRPARLLDTRIGQAACSAPGAPIAGGTVRTESARVACAGVILPDDALAIVGNTTVVNNSAGSGPGYLTLYPGGAARPVVSNLNYAAGKVLSNAFTVGLGSDGKFQIYAHSTTDVIVDVTGYYSASAAPDPNGASGLVYESLPNAVRLLDTRPDQPACLSPRSPLAAKVVREQFVGGQDHAGRCPGVPAEARAVVGNMTVVNNVAGNGFGYVTLYPSGAEKPLVSQINYEPNQVLSNAFTVGLGEGAFSIYPWSTINFIADITGFFAP